LQANLSAEQNKEIDDLVDGRLQLIGNTEDRIVIDSRTAWHWIPGSFKVFLDLDLFIASERILGKIDQARRDTEHIHDDPKQYAQLLQDRLDSESRRYKTLYDIDPYVMSNYDLVVDTAEHDLKAVIELVLTEYRAWLQQAGMKL
jgi:cytidylate kinase